MESFTCPICNYHEKNPFLEVWDHQQNEQFSVVKCSECGLVSLDELPSPALLEKYYADSYHYQIKEKGFVHFLESNLNQAMHQKHLKMIERKTGKMFSGRKLLDLGCGSGYFLKFAKLRGWEVYGVEMSNYAADIARKQGISVSTKSVTEANFLSEEFDVITMFNVLEHMTNLNEVMANNYRWLKPGGLLVVEVPNVNSMQRNIFGGNWVHWDVPRHIFHFSPETLRKLAEKNGFKVIEEYSLPFSSHEVAGWLHSLSFALKGKPKRSVSPTTLSKKDSCISLQSKMKTFKLLVSILCAELVRVFPSFLYPKAGVKTYILKKTITNREKMLIIE